MGVIFATNTKPFSISVFFVIPTQVGIGSLNPTPHTPNSRPFITLVIARRSRGNPVIPSFLLCHSHTNNKTPFLTHKTNKYTGQLNKLFNKNPKNTKNGIFHPKNTLFTKTQQLKQSSFLKKLFCKTKPNSQHRIGQPPHHFAFDLQCTQTSAICRCICTIASSALNALTLTEPPFFDLNPNTNGI